VAQPAAGPKRDARWRPRRQRARHGAAVLAHRAHGFGGNDLSGVISNNTTPLMKASHMGDAAIVRQLIAAGARLDLRNADGGNALWLACVGNRLDTIDQ
jgi:thiosulfate/3-mercaptopyruvate sulfurtransferase